MASDVQYLVVRDTTQASVWSGNILDSVVNGEDTFFVDASVPHGMVRWYKVAAFNDISKEQVLSKPVRGFSIFDPLTITRSDKGLDDTIIVKWEKEQAFKSYFVEWSTKDSIDEETQKFRFPVDSLGSFENSDYTTDSAVIKITEDSLKGRKIYIRVWAQNDFGKSEPTQSEGWVKLEKPDLIDVTDGQLQDSLALKIKRSAVADEDNSLRYQISFKKNKEDLFVKGYYELDLATATPSGDSIILDTITLQNSDAGFVYYVGVRAVNDLPNTMSGAIIDSGYSRLPAVNLATGEPLEGYINISWLKKNIGGDTLNYFVCKSKVNVGTVDTIDTVYGVDVLEMVSYNDSAVTVSENYEYFVYSYAPTRFGEKFSDSSNHVVNFAKIGLVDSLRQVEDYKRDTILMIWKQIPAVDSYVVYRSEDNDVDNKVAVDTLVFTEAPFTDKSADLKNNPGKIFYYWIAGLKGSDRGPVREIGAAAFTKLEMVDEIFAGKGESTQGISLKWSKSDLATSYNVFFDTLGGSGYDFLAAIGVEDDDTSHIFYRSEYSSEFSDGVQYLFRVQPVNEYCIAEISDTSVAVDTGYLKLLPVDSFYFYYDSVRFDTIKLNWAEETTPNLYYYLYRSVDKNGEKTLLDSMQADTNYYIDKGKGLAGDKLVGGKKYWYYLTTAVQGLKGGSSDTVEVQTYNLEYNIGIYDGAWSKLPEPAFITASGVFDYATKDNKPDSSYADSVVIRWSRVENAQSYALVGDTAREFVYSDARYQMSLTSDSVYNLSLPELEIADLGKLLYFKVAALNDLDGYDVSKATFSDVCKGFALLLAADSLRLDSVKFDKFVFRCKAVENADEYILYKKDGANFDPIDTSANPRLEDTTVIPGDDGYYKVRVYNDSTGFSSWTDSIFATSNPYPPAGVTATKGVSVDTIAVSWDMDKNRIPDIDSFFVYAKNIKPLSPMVTVDTVEADYNFATDTVFDDGAARKVGQKYLYYVRSYRNGKYSEISEPDTGWKALPDVDGLTADTLDAQALFVTVRWNGVENLCESGRYLLARVSSFDTVYYEDLSDTLYKDYDIQGGMAYKYSVKVYNPEYLDMSQPVEVWSQETAQKFVSQNWSDTAFGGKRFVLPVLDIEKNMYQILQDTIQISWQEYGIATAFNLAYDTTIDFSSDYCDTLKIVNNQAGDSSSYNFTQSGGLDEGQTYYFKLQVVDSGGTEAIWDSVASLWSAVDSGWSKLNPPALVVASDSITDKIRVDWAESQIANVTYEVRMVSEFYSDVVEKDLIDTTWTFDSPFSQGQKGFIVRNVHPTYGRSAWSDTVYGVGKQAPPEFYLRPSKGEFYDSVYLRIEEPLNLSGKMNYRIYVSTDKDEESFAKKTELTNYYDSILGVSAYALKGNVLSDSSWYGKKLYFRVASQVQGFDKFSDKGVIDSGWTKLLPTAEIDTVDVGTLDTSVIGIKWAKVANADSFKIERKRFNETEYAALKTVTDTFWLDTIEQNQRTHAFLYRVQSLSGLSQDAGTDGIVNSDSKFKELDDTLYLNVYQVQNLTATKGEFIDTVRLSWNGVLDEPYTVVRYQKAEGGVYDYAGNVAYFEDQKASDGFVDEVTAENGLQPGKWYFYNVYLQGDMAVYRNSIDSGYAKIPALSRADLWINNDTADIVANLQENVVNNFDSVIKIGIVTGKDFVDSVRFDTIGNGVAGYVRSVSVRDAAVMDTFKFSPELYGEFDTFRLKIVNEVVSDTFLDVVSFTPLQPSQKVEVVKNGVSSDSIILLVKRNAKNSENIDSVVIRRYAWSDPADEERLVYPFDAASDTLVDKDVVQGKFYVYQAAYFSDVTGISRYGASIDTGFAKLEVPEFDSVSKGTSIDNITLRWNKIDDAQGYRLYRRSDENGQYEVLVNEFYLEDSDDTTYVDNQKYPSCKYIAYKVQAVGVDTNSTLSAADSGYRAFDKVEDLRFAGKRRDTIKLTFSVFESIKFEDFGKDGVKLYRWDDVESSDDTTGYAVPTTAYIVDSVTEGEFRTYTISDTSADLELGKLYFYKVQVNTDVDSKLSNMAHGYLDLPKTGRATASFGVLVDSVSVVWDSVQGVNDYELIRESVNGGRRDSVEVSDTTALDFYGGDLFASGFEPGKFYAYSLRALCEIDQDTVFGDATSRLQLRLVSQESEADTGWSEMPPLDDGQVYGYNDTLWIEKTSPFEIDARVKERVNITVSPANGYVREVYVYRKDRTDDASVFVPIDTVYGSGEVIDSLLTRGREYSYRFKVKNDTLSEKTYDIVSYTYLKPIDTLKVTHWDTSGVTLSFKTMPNRP